MMNNAFQTLVEKADLLKRSDLMQLLQMSLKMNSMLNKVINKQENLRDKYNKKGASPGVPSDGSSQSADINSPSAAEPRQFEYSASQDSPADASRDAGPEQDDLAASDKFSHSKVCREITKAVSDMESIPAYQSTYNTGTGTLPGKPSDSCTEKIPPAGAACWEQMARKNQLMPKGDWRIWMILAGRGFGKTRAAAEAIRKLALSGKYKRIALIANTIEEAKQVMVEGVSGLQNISQDSDELTYTPSRRELRWKNGTIATLYGAENYQQLRGPQFDLAWVDEFAKFLYPRETFEQLSFALRMGDDPKLILTTTPRPIPFIKELMARDDVVTVRGSSLENEKNLSPTFLKHLEYLKGTRLEAQEIYAEIVEDNPNTLWSWRDIENCYRDPPHFIENIVIGVDPAMTCGKRLQRQSFRSGRRQHASSSRHLGSESRRSLSQVSRL